MHEIASLIHLFQWSPIHNVAQLFEQGGWVLELIALVALLLLSLSIERFWYLFVTFRPSHQLWVNQWRERMETASWCAHRIRGGMLASADTDLHKSTSLIKVCIIICPLLGLLGTVTGMVSVFEVMAFSGTGNARLMAAGISKATIPTMAGMMVAILGLLLSANIERLARLRHEQLARALSVH